MNVDLNSQFGDLQQELDRIVSTGLGRSRGDITAFWDSVQPTIDATRQRMLDVDLQHQSARAKMLARLNDDLARLDAQHHKTMSELSCQLERLIALRE